MPIKALDESTVKLITTTQVITSVYTATKELIENALDAGSSSVEITLTDYGISQIEVKDDGCGISKADVPCVALPSFTSKITNFQDLDVLDTYGFRGEALCALCAIADVKITTKTIDEDNATSYTLNSHGSIVKSELWHGCVGTTVLVNDIFKHVPVRRQIVMNKVKAKQDVKLLESLIKGFSICKPHVRFLYRVNGGTLFMKPHNKSIRESISYVLGKKIVSNMEWIEFEDTELTIKLLIPSRNAKDLSDLCRTGQDLLFINDRYIKNKEIDRLIEKILIEYFGQKIPAKKKLIFLLYTLIDSNNIDVNLEPNKTAVFFKEKEKFINILEKLLKNYYNIPFEEPVQEDLSCDVSKPYDDYTQRIDNEEQWHACKKRKIDNDEKVSETDEILNDRIDCVPSTDNNMPFTRSVENPVENNPKKKFSISRLDGPSLSEDDSNEAVKHCEPIMVQPCSNGNLPEIIDIGNDENDGNETLSQLPVVDLGDDFELNHFSDRRQDEQTNTEKEAVQKKARSYTLEEWSKGHVLQGGINVMPYSNSDGDELRSQYNYSIDESTCGKSTCRGFLEYSKEFRPQLLKANPNITAAEVARKLISMWKELPSEERGLYRDQAEDEQANRKAAKAKSKHKANEKINLEKSKEKFLKMFERVKTKKMEDSEPVLRTAIPWEIDLKSVTRSFEMKSNATCSILVVGSLTNNLWIVQNGSQLWLLDISRFNNELSIIDTNLHKMPNIESVERSLKQWLLEKEDLSMMHPIHSLSSS